MLVSDLYIGACLVCSAVKCSRLCASGCCLLPVWCHVVGLLMLIRTIVWCCSSLCTCEELIVLLLSDSIGVGGVFRNLVMRFFLVSWNVRLLCEVKYSLIEELRCFSSVWLVFIVCMFSVAAAVWVLDVLLVFMKLMKMSARLLGEVSVDFI